MIFDDSGDLKNQKMKDDDDLFDLFKVQNIEANKPEDEANLESDGFDPSSSKNMKEE